MLMDLNIRKSADIYKSLKRPKTLTALVGHMTPETTKHINVLLLDHNGCNTIFDMFIWHCCMMIQIKCGPTIQLESSPTLTSPPAGL